MWQRWQGFGDITMNNIRQFVGSKVRITDNGQYHAGGGRIRAADQKTSREGLARKNLSLILE